MEEAEATLKHVEEARKSSISDGGGRGEVDQGTANTGDPLGSTHAVSKVML